MSIICKHCGRYHEAYIFKNVWKYVCNQELRTEVVTTEERKVS